MTLSNIPKSKNKVIVIGNEKGGCGKTTTSINLITNLLYDNNNVTCIDIDSRQKSLTNFFDNRKKYIDTNKTKLPMPNLYIVNPSRSDSQIEAQKDELNRLSSCIAKAATQSEYTIIDAPGNDTYLSRIAHSFADIIVTPINDSFIDLSVLAKFHDESFQFERHGIYSEIIWDAKKEKAKRDNKSIQWFVVRNRLSNLNANNKKNMATALTNLSKRLGCKVLDGFSERVIYKEMFLKGLALPDVINTQKEVKLQLSHIAAREELRNFMHTLGIYSQNESENNTSKATG